MMLAAVQRHLVQAQTEDHTLGAQIETLKQRFGLRPFVLDDDRGRPTSARIREELKAAGFYGSVVCESGKSRTSPARRVRCGCHCSTEATWPISPPPSIPAIGWWPPAIPT
jgi:hypothetical protein